MTISSVEQAYSILANAMVAASPVENWECLLLKATIYSDMVNSEFKAFHNGFVDETSYVKSILDPIFYLRDNLLAKTGERIWGLIFTLYPNGKFNIEYDYNKPEGYEETDETISVNDSIKGLGDSSKSEE